jgi:SNF2 family DNA or RNA helicase
MRAFHKQFGEGKIINEDDNTIIIEFPKGIERLKKEDVEIRETAEDKIKENKYDDTSKVITKTQAALIRAINETWGVFSVSSIDLLPHQLWVCNRVIKNNPIRYLIADDVGLGKTIEAGLILWPLLDSNRVKRFLILTPAGLVDQWQSRMYKMFDIRMEKYNSNDDKDNNSFWETHSNVVASISTLDRDHKDRIKRLLSADTWDLVIIDEAHHLNAEEHGGGKTLSYRLIEEMQEANKIYSLIFFTGTPHRGKDFGFWSLMKLLDADEFDPKKNYEDQYKSLPKYLIRNNKQNVTDMSGRKLFTEIRQNPGIFHYNDDETLFYNRMTEFIVSGKTYANKKDGKEKTQVILVLIALQKIASSSIAAIKSALQTRVNTLNKEQNKNEIFDELDTDEKEETEEAKDTSIALKKYSNEVEFKLMDDEISNLSLLIDLADKVKEESRVKEIINIIKTKYPAEPVLFFTEYKRTQALVMSALISEFGESLVGFINGDEYIKKVKLKDGSLKDYKQDRETTAEQFNKGRIKYLVSTEASGEGVDLQENCHILIHIDLPWNPMRLHQRVGRLSRYGQTKDVEVISMRNPDTIESHIWDLLQEKINRIKKMFAEAVDDPEDLMQLVLGMQDNNFYNKLYSEAKSDNLKTWFDAQTQTFGDESAIKTVERMIGNAARFNLSGLKDVPKLDLPDLEMFFKTSLELAQRRVNITDDRHFSFLTPESWQNEYGIKDKYDNLVFKRKASNGVTIGVGHKIFTKALDFVLSFTDNVCIINSPYSFFVYRIYDKITHKRGNIQSRYLILKYRNEQEYEWINEETFYKILVELKNKTKEIHALKIDIPSDIDGKIISRLKDFVSVFQESGYELFTCLWGIQ